MKLAPADPWPGQPNAKPKTKPDDNCFDKHRGRRRQTRLIMVCEPQLKKGKDRVFLDILETLALPLKKALRSMRKILEARFGRAVAGISVVHFLPCH